MNKCQRCGAKHGETIPGRWKYSNPIIIDIKDGYCQLCDYDIAYQAFLDIRANITTHLDSYGVSDDYAGTMFENAQEETTE